ncbi:MAG: tetratricopeptide (TPR) repeat protein [Flavobacteriales bacterium]|jgi:tetratricopeptide (TPR) repeat protein
MFSNPPSYLLTATLSLFLTSSCLAQFLEQGKTFYENRSDGAVGLQALPDNVDRAINYFQQAYEQQEDELLSGTLLVEAYTYKARFVEPEADKKDVFKTAKEIGEDLIKKYPDDARARFAYIAALGLWAERIGALTAATSGVVGKIMKNTKALIAIDPEYRNGIGNRIVGVMNYEAPYIPFIMSWPDKQKAVGIIHDCLAKDPHDRGNNYYYAEALIENGKSDEAIPYLEKVLALQPKEDFLMEDRAFADWAKRRLLTFESDKN